MNVEDKAVKKRGENACLIPARSGSKGIPNKNLTLFNGTPLIQVTIDLAKRSKLFDEIFVSSDDTRILKLAKGHGVVPLERPSSLATDTSTAAEYLKYHFSRLCQFTTIMLLQPTSPLRTVLDLEVSLNKLWERNPSEDFAVISVSKSQSSIENLVTVNSGGNGEMFVASKNSNRQDFREMFELNGAIFLSTSRYLEMANFNFRNMKFIPYIMPMERSVDIDTKLDFEIAQFLAGREDLN